MTIDTRGFTTLISVYDMPSAVSFYQLLGFTLVDRSPAYEVLDGIEHFHWCTLRRNNAELMLNTEYDTGERPSQRPAFAPHPFGTWFYLGCPDLDDAYAQLQSAGIPCDPPRLTLYGNTRFRTLTLRDPDGHGITLQWPANDTLTAKE